MKINELSVKISKKGIEQISVNVPNKPEEIEKALGKLMDIMEKELGREEDLEREFKNASNNNQDKKWQNL